MDLDTRTDEELDQWIVNYEREPGATALPFGAGQAQAKSGRVARSGASAGLAPRWFDATVGGAEESYGPESWMVCTTTESSAVSRIMRSCGPIIQISP
jgi:hypothetical protein